MFKKSRLEKVLKKLRKDRSTYFSDELNNIVFLEYDQNKFEDIVKNNKIHKSTFKTSYYLGNDPIICTDKKYLISPCEIENSKYFVESCFSAERAKVYALMLINEYNLLDKFKIEIE